MRNNNSKYIAYLFSPDGEDWVTDFGADTIQDVWENANNAGSKWFFYPFVAIVRNNYHNGWRRLTKQTKVQDHSLPEFYGEYVNTLGDFIGTLEEYGNEMIKATW